MMLLALLTVLQASVLFASEDLDKCTILTSDNFDRATDESNYFVMFYAPWCGHCKRLKPTWNELGSKWNDESTEANIAAVDCTVETSLCSSHGVKGYPTLKFFKKGEKEGTKYAGGRDLKSFEKFIRQTLDPSLVEPEPVVEPCEVPSADKGLLELKDCNFEQAIKSDYSFVKFYAPWCGHCKKLAPTWTELAEKYESVEKAKIIKLDCTVEKSACEKHQVGGFPTLILFKDGKLVEKYRGGRDLTALSSFLDKKVNGTGAEDPKEEGKPCPKPKKGETGVWDVEDCHFNYHISGAADAFVKFYAPWCGHCKKLAPTWEQLGQHYFDNENVRITKLDCTVHKEACENHKVRGFPTLIYFRNGKALSSYSGGRDYDALKTWVDSQLQGKQGAGKDEGDVKVIHPLGSQAELTKLSEIKPTLVIFFHASNNAHAADHKLFVEMKDNIGKEINMADVDCGVAEALCKAEKAFSDDETFVHMYLGGEVFKHASGAKSRESLRKFYKEALKDALIKGAKPRKDEL